MKPSRVNDFTISPADNQSAISKAKDLKQAEQALGNFYNRSGEVDLPEALKEAKRRRFWWYLIGLLTTALVLAVAGFFVFSGADKFGEEAIDFALIGPSAVPSGQTVEYRLTYNNNQTVGLKAIDINLRYPDGFTFMASEPMAVNEGGTNFILPTIAGKTKGEIIIKGQLVGQVGETKNFGVLLSYEPDNVRAQYSKSLSFGTELIASVINLEVTGPKELVLDQEALFKATYRNSSSEEIGGLLIRFVSPGGFELTIPELIKTDYSNNVWLLPDLEPNQESIVEFKGRFTLSAVPGEQPFALAVGVNGQQSEFIVQEEKILEVNVIKPQLKVSLTVNDVVLKSSADLGQEMSYQLLLANESDKPVTDLNVEIKIDGNYLDWLTLKDEGGGRPEGAEGTIVWTGRELASLQALQPGGRAILKWSIKLKSVLPAGIRTAASFNTQAKASGQQLRDKDLQPVLSESNVITTKINTVLKLSAEGRYYTDQLIKLGSGPLPPQVNQTTTYVLFWRLNNSLNDLEKAEITATLPLGVSWTGQTTASLGNVAYNPNTREVSWRLDKVVAWAGNISPAPEASFEVAVTPAEYDADKILVLIKTSTASGRDSFSGADVIATSKLVTTDLEDDLAAQGKGVVVR
ncbi:hypothetical protein KKC17_04350 [Patescibacteria group bacterium]|nr:hypothetical protein [Patescibacteria group bacterium]